MALFFNFKIYYAIFFNLFFNQFPIIFSITFCMFQLDFLPAATIEHVIETVILFAPRILMALLTLLIGNWLSRVAVNLIERAFRVRNIDESLQSFLASLLSIGLKVILVITAAGLLGFETTSFVAILGAAGLAVGLALQGSLANFAGGVLTLVFKPYKAGDLIEAQG